MADTFNYLGGNVTCIPMVPDTAVAQHIGDLLFQDPVSKKSRPASGMVNQGSETLNQQAFHDQFAGVALQRGGALESGEKSFNLNPLPAQDLVAGSGEFQFACAATTWYPGDLVGPANNAGGTALLNQTVKKVTALANSIGIAMPEPNAVGQSRTTVRVQIKSSLLGGIPSLAAGSSSGTL